MLADRIQFYDTRKGPIALLMVAPAVGQPADTCIISYDFQKIYEWVTQHPDLMADNTCTRMLLEIRRRVPYRGPHPAIVLGGEGGMHLIDMLVKGSAYVRDTRRVPFVKTLGVLKGVVVNGVEGYVYCHRSDPEGQRYVSALMHDDAGFFGFFCENSALFVDQDDDIPGVDRNVQIIGLPEAIAACTMLGELLRKGVLT